MAIIANKMKNSFNFFQVGEQILEINGIDFVSITHADAAEIIRTSRRMTMVLKDVGKIPISRIIYDKTEWIKQEQLKQRFS